VEARTIFLSLLSRLEWFRATRVVGKRLFFIVAAVKCIIACMKKEIETYHNALSAGDNAVCALLYKEISANFRKRRIKSGIAIQFGFSMTTRLSVTTNSKTAFAYFFGAGSLMTSRGSTPKAASKQQRPVHKRGPN
jgi:hypothetical protein